MLVVLIQALRSAKAVLLTVWGCICDTRFRCFDNLYFTQHNSSPVIEAISLLIDSLNNEACSLQCAFLHPITKCPIFYSEDDTLYGKHRKQPYKRYRTKITASKSLKFSKHFSYTRWKIRSWYAKVRVPCVLLYQSAGTLGTRVHVLSVVCIIFWIP